MSKPLVVSLMALSTSAVATPFLVRVGYGERNDQVVIVALGISLPVLACVFLTLAQQRRGEGGRLSFAPAPLAAAAMLMTISVVAICLLGYVGALVDFLTVPAAAAFLALAWVQPRESDEVWTVLFGITFTILVAWFAGRADEYISEGLISGGSIVVILAVLRRLRARGSVGQNLPSPPSA
jgi:hypothetical protein